MTSRCAVKAVVLATCVAALGAAPALADATGASGAPATETASTVVPTAQSATAPHIRLGLGGALIEKHVGYVLRGARVTINGSVAGKFHGTEVTVKIQRGKHTHTHNVTLRTSGEVSVFKLKYRISRTGHYRFTAEPAKADPAGPQRSGSTYVRVVGANIHRGQHGIAVRVIQNKLAQLGYVTPTAGRFNDATGRALVAFRKVNRMARIARAGNAVGKKLAADRGTFKLRYPRAGRHIEVSISRQVMAFAVGRRAIRIYPVSTGKPSTPTVRGRFHVYMKDQGINAKGMVDSNYFIRGYAIHGYVDVPTYAASHGCVRVPVPDAASIFRWVRIGDRVDVY